MKEASEFFRKNREATFNKINTVLPGTIERFDASKQVADVTLSTGVTITEVRVMCFLSNDLYVKLPYSKGDKVIVAFAQQDIDNFVYGNAVTPSKARFRLDDAFVLGSFAISNSSMPNSVNGAIEIGSKNGSSKVVITNDYIDLVGTVKINGNIVQG